MTDTNTTITLSFLCFLYSIQDCGGALYMADFHPDTNQKHYIILTHFCH